MAKPKPNPEDDQLQYLYGCELPPGKSKSKPNSLPAFPVGPNILKSMAELRRPAGSKHYQMTAEEFSWAFLIQQDADAAVQMAVRSGGARVLQQVAPSLAKLDKINGARVRGKQAKANARYEKIVAYLDEQVKKRGARKQPSLTALRDRTAKKMGCTSRTVLNAEKAMGRKYQ